MVGERVSVGIRAVGIVIVGRVGVLRVGIAVETFRFGRLIDGKLGAGYVGNDPTLKVLFAGNGADLLTPAGPGILAQGVLGDGSPSGSRVGTGMATGIGVKVGALPLKPLKGNGVGSEKPNDGMPFEGMLKDGSPMVGLEMLRLGDGIVRDGTATDGTVNKGTAKCGKPIVGSEIPRTGNELVTDDAPIAGKPVDVTLSTLFVGISKIGNPLGVAGNVMSGRPKESTADGGVGIESMMGAGMANRGGPVIAGKGKLGDGRIESGLVTEGRPNETELTEGKLSEPRLTEGTESDVRVGTETPTSSILSDRSSGGFAEPVGIPESPVRACNTDWIDAVRLDGWPAGTVTGVEPETGTVIEGSRIGLAEIREASRREGTMLERCMALAADGFFSFSFFFFRRERLS